MKTLVKKAVKTGFGLGLLTLEEAQKFSRAVRKTFDLNEAESKKLAKDLVKKSMEVRKEALSLAEKRMNEFLAKSGLMKKKPAKKKPVKKKSVKRK
jgi:polyhydroxyalkanoate synthesis regulator phasin